MIAWYRAGKAGANSWERGPGGKRPRMGADSGFTTGGNGGGESVVKVSWPTFIRKHAALMGGDEVNSS